MYICLRDKKKKTKYIIFYSQIFLFIFLDLNLRNLRQYIYIYMGKIEV
jgi:hypothetical protein